MRQPLHIAHFAHTRETLGKGCLLIFRHTRLLCVLVPDDTDNLTFSGVELQYRIAVNVRFGSKAASATPAPGMLPSVCHHIVVRHHPNLLLKRRGGAATWTKKPLTSIMETTTCSRRSSRIISTRITSLNFRSPLFQKKFAESIRNRIHRRLNEDNIFTTCFGSRPN